MVVKDHLGLGVDQRLNFELHVGQKLYSPGGAALALTTISVPLGLGPKVEGVFVSVLLLTSNVFANLLCLIAKEQLPDEIVNNFLLVINPSIYFMFVSTWTLVDNFQGVTI